MRLEAWGMVVTRRRFGCGGCLSWSATWVGAGGGHGQAGGDGGWEVAVVARVGTGTKTASAWGMRYTDTAIGAVPTHRRNVFGP